MMPNMETIQVKVTIGNSIAEFLASSKKESSAAFTHIGKARISGNEVELLVIWTMCELKHKQIRSMYIHS